MGVGKLTVLACAVVTGLAIGVTAASADPTAEHNKNAGVFTVECPGMASFEVTAVGAVGFVEGGTMLAISQFEDQGSLDLVECEASGDGRTFTVFIQFVQRG